VAGLTATATEYESCDGLVYGPRTTTCACRRERLDSERGCADSVRRVSVGAHGEHMIVGKSSQIQASPLALIRKAFVGGGDAQAGARLKAGNARVADAMPRCGQRRDHLII